MSRDGRQIRDDAANHAFDIPDSNGALIQPMNQVQ
jgi:hypothetical protein